jgi:hypothetical protein
MLYKHYQGSSNLFILVGLVHSAIPLFGLIFNPSLEIFSQRSCFKERLRAFPLPLLRLV